MEKETLSKEDIREQILKVYDKYNLKNKKLLVIIPDNTRTAPIDTFFKLFYEIFGREVKKLDYLIALGTHPMLSEEGKLKRVGIDKLEKEQLYNNINIMNHRWDRKETFVKIGSIGKREMGELTDGFISDGNDILINKIIYDYNIVITVGPVFPHSIVGFSGSSKYLFPGICGWNFIDTTHWLGALRTNLKTIGIKDTPARRLIERATQLVSVPVIYFNLVVDNEDLKGLFVGDDNSAWSEAVELSSKINIRYIDKPLKKVLSIPSPIYDDFWTGAKAVYKIEPIVEDGGELIVYAPNIKDFSITHNKFIEEMGYHIKDYFLHNMSQYNHLPKAVMSYCTLVKGAGTLQNGREEPRINVILSSGISKERCEKVHINYKDQKKIHISEWENREEEGIVVIYNSGEVLYRIKQ